MGPPLGILEICEANKQFARAVSNLSGSCPKGSTWKRELVFLEYKYLLVTDHVKQAKDVETRWTLHSIKEPKIKGFTTTIQNEDMVLYCQTLLPEDARLSQVGDFHHKTPDGKDQTFPGLTGKPEQMLGGWRLDVMPSVATAKCLYVHVLCPAPASEKMPVCSLKKEAGNIMVSVDNLKYTFSVQ